MTPNLRPDNPYGANNLVVMERIVQLNEAFSMEDMPGDEGVVRWAWGVGLLAAVSAGPLRYEATAEGRKLTKKYLLRRDAMHAHALAEQ